jgi:hypothetical protein
VRWEGARCIRPRRRPRRAIDLRTLLAALAPVAGMLLARHAARAVRLPSLVLFGAVLAGESLLTGRLLRLYACDFLLAVAGSGRRRRRTRAPSRAGSTRGAGWRSASGAPAR